MMSAYVRWGICAHRRFRLPKGKGTEVFTNISVYHIIAVTLISIVLFVFSSIPSLVRISKIVPKDVIYTN